MKLFRSVGVSVCALAAAGTLAVTSCPGVGAANAPHNLVKNGSCAQASPSGSYGSFTGNYDGPSSFADWEVFNNTTATTTTDILPSSRPHPPATMCHVVTYGTNNGVDQVISSFNTGPSAATFSVWVYVVQGEVGIGAGNGGDTGFTALDDTPGKWVDVTGTQSASPVNNFIVYSFGSGVSDFYFESATLTKA